MRNRISSKRQLSEQFYKDSVEKMSIFQKDSVSMHRINYLLRNDIFDYKKGFNKQSMAKPDQKK